MYVIIWEYHVKAEHVSKFEQIYHSEGAWAELFKKGTGYLGTELIRDETQPQRYITIDQWDSAEDYEAFRVQWKEEYEALDAQCEGLTEQETLFGKWEAVDYKVR
ncbi:MAG: antibiotic biosynthesis monooxygenase [Anaerolineae bacterium]|nr:antibiotic biosynthesis monooxygenase [Anaerolineae bacterium]